MDPNTGRPMPERVDKLQQELAIIVLITAVVVEIPTVVG